MKYYLIILLSLVLMSSCSENKESKKIVAQEVFWNDAIAYTSPMMVVSYVDTMYHIGDTVLLSDYTGRFVIRRD